MATVGIIANPASGKDIRRLVAHGSVFDNHEKVNIVRRVLLGLEAAGVERVLFMPDYYGIGQKALDGIRVGIEVEFLDMPLRADQRDSTEAARLLEKAGVGCLITLGGDGTNRAVAKGSVAIPVMPISTGTNNVFPFMIEGTLAGLAAGVVATGAVDVERVTIPTPRLDVLVDGQPADLALVDVVVYDDIFVASRAIWDMSKVREIILARAEPGNIGLSSVGGSLYCPHLDARHGVYIRLGQNGEGLDVSAPVAPGVIERVRVSGYRLLALGDEVEVTCKPSVLALDGEREVEVRAHQDVRIRLSDQGPRVVDLWRTLHEAARLGLFVQQSLTAPSQQGNCLLYRAGVCLNPCEEFCAEE